MNDNFLSELGIACLIFWGILGVLLIWHVHRIKDINKAQSHHQEPSEEGMSTENSLLEHLRQMETCDHPIEIDCHNTDQPTIQDEMGESR